MKRQWKGGIILTRDAFIVLPCNVKECFTGLGVSSVSKFVLLGIDEEQLTVETAVTPSTIVFDNSFHAAKIAITE